MELNAIPYFRVNNLEQANVLFPRLIEVCNNVKLRSTIYDLLSLAINKNYLIEENYHKVHEFIQADFC